MKTALVTIALLTVAAIEAQTVPTPIRSITATGNANISATPDMASVDVSVTTEAATAQDASTKNATIVASVIAALQAILGAGGNIKTINYSLNPVYNNAGGITGYSATNTVEATVIDLTTIGRVIDAGISAGANRVSGIQFGLRDSSATQAQALKTAAALAVTQAKAIASGLGVQTGRVLHASQGGNIITPSAILAPTAPGATTTPVEPGLIQVSATVTIELEITS
jgi:uncharacterized protein YggE